MKRERERGNEGEERTERIRAREERSQERDGQRE
jgi:hypothetical protein